MSDDLLREYVRGIMEEDRLAEGVLDNVMEYVKEKGAKAKEAIKKFIVDLMSELEETGAGAMLLQKIVMGEKLEPNEMEFLKDQAKDVAVGSFLLGLFAVPGGGIATAGLVKAAKKFNIDLMPSSFNRPDGAR